MVEFGVGVLSLHGCTEEVDDVFAVVGDFEYVLLEGVLDAHGFEFSVVSYES